MANTQTQTTLPKSSAELLQALDSLPYRKRVDFVAKLANQHKKNPDLSKLIKELREHPAPPGTSVESDDGLKEVLPPHKRDVANHYHEIHLSVVAAAASKEHLQVLKEELSTPSVNFKRFVSKEVVRQEPNDDWLFDAIVKSVASVRKQLLHQCIRFRRVKVLDRLALKYSTESNVDVVADFLHGCSRSVVKELLVKEEFLNNKRLQWLALARFHGDLIVEMMRSELSQSSMYARANVWQKWNQLMGYQGSRHLLLNGKQTLAIIELFKDFPPVHDVVPRETTLTREEEKKVPPAELIFTLPNIISANMQHFLNHRKFASRLFDAMIPMSGIKVNKNFSVVWCPVSSSIQRVHSVELFNYIKRLFELSNPSSLAFRIGWDSQFLMGKNEPFRCLPHFAYPELIQLSDLLIGLIQSVSLDTFAKRQIARVWLSYYCEEINRRMYSSFVTAVKKNQPVELTPLEKLLTQILDKWLAFLVEGWQLNQIKTGDLQSIAALLVSLPKIPSIISKIVSFFRPFICTTAIIPPGTSVPPRDSSFANVFVLKRGRRNRFQFVPAFTDTDNDEKDVNALRYKIIHSLFQINVSILKHYRMLVKDPRYSVKNREFARQQMRDVIEAFWFLYTTEPHLWLSQLTEICSYIKDPNLKTKLWNDCFVTKPDLLQFAVKNRIDLLIAFWSNLRVKDLQTVLEQLLADNSQTVDLKTKDLLKAFQDLDNHKSRKALQDDSDKNSPSERLDAIQRLSIATIMAQSTTHCVRTLKFIQSKIKNEVIDRRVAVLNALIGSSRIPQFIGILTKQQQKHFSHTYLRDDATDELFNLWFTILKDTLEASDLFENEDPGDINFFFHPIFKNFMDLSRAAFIRANKCDIKDTQQFNKFFNFAVELQWRIALFCWGPRKANAKFVFDIKFDSPTARHRQIVKPKRKGGTKILQIEAEPFKRDPERAKRFVNAVINAYTTRFMANDPKFNIHDRNDIFVPLFDAVRELWQEIPVLREHLEYLLKTTKEKKQKDHEGLLIIDLDDDLIQTFETVLRFPRQKHWSQVPVLNEYVETILRSRQAKTVLKRWLYHTEVYQCKHKHRKDRKIARDENVNKLLSISKSAIYLDMVWKHLSNNRQDRLDEFLGAQQQTFRGVFFVEPKSRRIYTSAIKSKVKVRAVLTTQRVSRGRGFLGGGLRGRGLRGRGFLGGGLRGRGRGRGRGGGGVMIRQFLSIEEFSEVTKQIEKEKEREQKVVEEMKNGDHPDLWCFEGCFNKHKLLPRQSRVLAQQWMRQVFNEDRSMPERIKAMARWTLLPTTSYIDIAEFMEKNKKLSVNLIETCLRGAMVGDEPTAALRWLLSPQFLSGDRARVAVYAVAQCLPHLPSNGLSTICRIIMTGERRHLLKVTTYKEIIRLLSRMPTEVNVKLIIHEWNRKELHRDVKITIIRTAFDLLRLSEEKRRFGWEILEATLVKHTQNEVLATLLATKATDKEVPQLNVNVAFDSSHFLHPSLQQVVGDLTRRDIPSQERLRYVEKILFPLAQLSSLSIESDLKWMAIYSAFHWRHYKKELVSTAVKFFEDYLLNFSNKLWTSDKKWEREVQFRRCVAALSGLLEGCGISKSAVDIQRVRSGGTTQFQEHFAPIAHFINVSNGLCTKIKELSLPKKSVEDARVRIALIRLVKELFNLWNAHVVQSKIYSDLVEKELIAPFKQLGNLFWQELTEQQFKKFTHSTPASTVIPFLEEVVNHTVNNPTYTNFVVNSVKTYLTNAYNDVTLTYNTNLELHKVVHSLVNGSVAEKLNSGDSSALFALRLGTIALQSAPRYGNSSDGNLLQFFKRSLRTVAEVKVPWFDAYDPLTDLLETIKVVIDQCCPFSWVGMRTFTFEIQRLVNGLVQFALEVNNKQGVSVEMIDTMNNFMRSLLKSHPDFLAVACSVETIIKFVEVMLNYCAKNYEKRHLLSQDFTKLVSNIHVFVDGVYNRNLRQPQNERLTENSKKTVEILSTFFTLSLPDTMKQNPVLKMRFLQLYYETGLALLAEFRSFLWEHDQIARNFLQQAIPGLLDVTGATYLQATLSNVFIKSYELTIADRKPLEKRLKKLLNFLNFLLNDLSKKSSIIATHVCKHITIDLIVHFTKLTSTRTENVMHPQLVEILETLFNDPDDSVKLRALSTSISDFDFDNPHSSKTSLNESIDYSDS